MARPRKPTNVLELKGAFKKDPQRKRPSEPVPTGGIGPAPSALPAKLRVIWDEVVAICPPGVLGNSDRIALEALVRLLNEFRTDYAEFSGARMSQLVSLMGRFGLTPSDRSKIVVPKGKEKNPFANLG
jgi:hypothetical protein